MRINHEIISNDLCQLFFVFVFILRYRAIKLSAMAITLKTTFCYIEGRIVGVNNPGLSFKILLKSMTRR